MTAALLAQSTIETVPADPTLVALSILTGAIGISLLALLATATRPRRPAVFEPSMDLLAEPPAVVDLLTDDFQVTPAAVPATLLDLAARRWLRVEELIDGRVQVRLRGRDGEGQLLPFERRVLEHLRATAVNGVIPAAALTTGPEGASDTWWKGFRREVVAEARARGLSRRRWPAFALGLAWATTIVAGGLLFLSLPDEDEGTIEPTWSLGAAGALVLASVVTCAQLTGSEAERDTDEGRERAGRWMAVREYLADHGNFDDASPAAVTIWDRYLAHAAAMDLAGRAVRELPLGAEDDRHAWSSAGGTWRPVTVRYPRMRVGWGNHPFGAVAIGLFGLALGTALAIVPYEVLTGDAFPDLTEALADVDEPARQWVERALLGVSLLGLLTGTHSALRFVRGALDLFVTREIEGPVLRRRRRGGQPPVYEQQSAFTKAWRMLQASNRRQGGGFDASGQWHAPEQPRYRWYVGVDDGASETIDAWRVRQAIYSSCNQHQHVRVRFSPRLGYVRSIEPAAAPAPVAPEQLATADAPAAAPGSPAAALLAAAHDLAAQHAPDTQEATE
jgi:hypothetical protein